MIDVSPEEQLGRLIYLVQKEREKNALLIDALREIILTIRSGINGNNGLDVIKIINITEGALRKIENDDNSHTPESTK